MGNLLCCKFVDIEIELTRTLTKAGNRGILSGGYPMRLAYTGKKSMSWRCDVKGCRAHTHTDLDVAKVLSWSMHNHGKHVSWKNRELELTDGTMYYTPNSQKWRKYKSGHGVEKLEPVSPKPVEDAREIHVEVMLDPITGKIRTDVDDR